MEDDSTYVLSNISFCMNNFLQCFANYSVGLRTRVIVLDCVVEIILKVRCSSWDVCSYPFVRDLNILLICLMLLKI
jgi:hypothetical protein